MRQSLLRQDTSPYIWSDRAKHCGPKKTIFQFDSKTHEMIGFVELPSCAADTENLLWPSVDTRTTYNHAPITLQSSMQLNYKHALQRMPLSPKKDNGTHKRFLIWNGVGICWQKVHFFYETMQSFKGNAGNRATLSLPNITFFEKYDLGLWHILEDSM